MQRVDRLIFSRSIAQIPVMVRQYVASVQKGNFHGFFDRLTYQKEVHLAALQLPISHLLAGFRTPVSKPLLELLLPYCIQDPVTEEYQAGREAISFLMDLTKQYDSSLFSSYDQALENYFSNYLFSSLFPFLYHEEGLSFEQTGILLAEQFALLRMLFAFFCHTDGKTGESQLIQAVVALSRSSQHSDLGGDIQKLIQSTGVKSFAHAAYLLR
ncbi:MAG: hypothetical protein ACLTKI_00630 [Lachnospiraceae bacterium]